MSLALIIKVNRYGAIPSFKYALRLMLLSAFIREKSLFGVGNSKSQRFITVQNAEIR